MPKSVVVKLLCVAAVAASALVLDSDNSNAQCSSGNCGGAVDSFAAMASNGYYGDVQPLFNNFFTQGGVNQADAGLYMSPVGVPGWVGHTYYTYQPLYPHQYLYKHRDRYHSYYDGGRGLNRTSVKYSYPPVRTGLKSLYKLIELPR